MNKKIFLYELKREIYLMYILLATMLFFIISLRINMFKPDYIGGAIYAPFIFIFMYIVILIPLVIYSYNLSRARLDLINSLPVKREEMFITKYIIGIIYFTVPYILTFALIIIYDNFMYSIPVEINIYFFLFLLKYYVACLLTYTITSFVCTLSGVQVYRILGSLYVSTIIFLVLSQLFREGLYYLKPYVNFTYIRFTRDELLKINDLFNYFYTIPQYLKQITTMLIYIILIFFISIKSYCMCKTENAEEVIVFNRIKPFILYFIAIPVSFYITLIYSNIAKFGIDSDERVLYITISLIIYFIIFIILSYALNGIIEKRINFQNKRKFFTNTIGVYIIFAIFMLSTMVYINRTSYYVDSDNNIIEISLYTSDNTNSEKITIVGKDSIEKFNDILSDIIESTPKYLKSFKKEEVIYNISYQDIDGYRTIEDIDESFYNILVMSKDEYSLKNSEAIKYKIEHADKFFLNSYNNYKEKNIENTYVYINGYLNVEKLSNDYLYGETVVMRSDNSIKIENYFDNGALYNALMTDLSNIEYKQDQDNIKYNLSIRGGGMYEYINISDEFIETIKIIESTF